jgi:ABC-2 type transport system ATP-binding protein
MRRLGTARGRHALAVLCAATLVAAACSGTGSDDDADGADEGGAAGTGASDATSTAERPACDREPAATPEAAAVDGVPSDLDVTSFDGTRIRAHWFPVDGATADEPAPTVLMGPGWGQPGDTNVAAAGVLGATSIARLRERGFNVLTWDPRGFGESEGTVQVNSPDAEGRDVQSLLDWVAAQPEAQLDDEGDPRTGMIGASYGGGIQTVTAAADCRVDALVPIMAWHSLETSLYKAGTPKMGWANILTSVSGAGTVDPHVTDASEAMNETGAVDEEDVEWFADRGPGDLVEDITAPTLFIQGTVDTLFTLDEAVTNYRALRDNDVPVAMLWYCGGHGTCLTGDGDPQRVELAGVAWLERWVKEDESVELGPRFDFVDQEGTRYTADDYPLPQGDPVTASGDGTLELVAEGGAGPVTDPPAATGPDILRSLVLPVTPAPAANAVDVAIPAHDEPALVVGAPRLALRYSGTAEPGERPTRVFAQLVDEASGLTVGNQVTPIEVTLDGESHTAEVDLEVVSYAMSPSSRLTLQLVATTVAYAPPRLGGSVTFDAIDLELPVAEGLTPAAAEGASGTTTPR